MKNINMKISKQIWQAIKLMKYTAECIYLIILRTANKNNNKIFLPIDLGKNNNFINYNT